MVPATWVPCQEEPEAGDALAALVGVVPVARVGRVAVTAVAVDGDSGVGDEVVAADDVRGQVGVGDVAGVDDGDGDAGAGGGVPGARDVHARGGLEQVPLLAVLGVVRGDGRRLVQTVRDDVGDLRVGLVLGDDVDDVRPGGVRAQLDEGGAGAEAALEVDVLAGLLGLGRGVGGRGLVRLGLGGAGLVADDEALGRGAGGGLGLGGRDGGRPGGGLLGDGDRGGGGRQQGGGDGGDGYQLPSELWGGTHGRCLSWPDSGLRGAAVEALRRRSGGGSFEKRRDGRPGARRRADPFGVTCGSAVVER